MGTFSRCSVDRFITENSTDARVLDLGCGRGPYASHFANRVGCDIKPSPAVHVVADAEALPFGAGVFDMVLSTEMLEHVPNPQRAVAEIGRVLRPGGRLVLTTRFLYPIHSEPIDYYRFTRYGLLHLFSGWQLERLSEDTSSLDTVLQLAELLTSSWSKSLRWPAKACLRAVHWAAGRLVTDHGVSPVACMATAGYLLVARKLQ